MVTEDAVTAGALALAKRNNASSHEPFMGISRAVLEAALSTDAEPVAFARVDDGGRLTMFSTNENAGNGMYPMYKMVPLYAAPPAPSVAVKALEWDKRGDDTFLSEPMDGVFRYHVWQSRNGEWYNSADPNRQPLETEKAAKSVCQADYEARIRSALSAQVQDVAGLQPVKRDIAVSIVDAVHGYTCEFSSDPSYHASQYDVAEQIIDDALRAASPANQEV